MPNMIVDRYIPIVGATETALLLVFLRFRHNRNGFVKSLSQSELAELTGVSKRHIYTLTRKLERMGLIEKTQRGGQKLNFYCLSSRLLSELEAAEQASETERIRGPLFKNDRPAVLDREKLSPPSVRPEPEAGTSVMAATREGSSGGFYTSDASPESQPHGLNARTGGGQDSAESDRNPTSDHRVLSGTVVPVTLDSDRNCSSEWEELQFRPYKEVKTYDKTCNDDVDEKEIGTTVPVTQPSRAASPAGEAVAAAAGVAATLDRGAIATAFRQSVQQHVEEAAVEKLIRSCRQVAPDVTTAEVLHFLSRQGAIAQQRDRINNPIGFLLSTVPSMLRGESFHEWREERRRNDQRRRAQDQPVSKRQSRAPRPRTTEPNPWRRILNWIRDHGAVTQTSFGTWLEPTQFAREQDSTLFVYVPNTKFFYITEKFGDQVEAAIHALDLPFQDVELLCPDESECLQEENIA